MKALYVTSWEGAMGKTTLCVGLGKSLEKDEQKVGYLRSAASEASPEDAQFIKEVLALEEPPEALSIPGSASDLKKAFDEITKGKDIVLVEGQGGIGAGETVRAEKDAAKALDAKVILILRCLKDPSWTKVIPVAQELGDSLLGIVINQVPQDKLESVKSEASSALGEQGLKLLGVLPEDRRLLGISMTELVKQLEATVMCCESSTDKLVENVMVGAMTPDSGADYFGRKDDKLVIAHGDRADLQTAALNTSTNGIVLTGGVGPVPKVRYLAEEKAVPILMTTQDTLPTLDRVIEAIEKAKFRQPAKADRAASIVAKHLDIEAVLQA
jgi:BioD-like phosphotransacetylase family protein